MWLVVWLCLTSHRQRGHLETAPHLLSLAKDVKLDKCTVSTGNCAKQPPHIYILTCIHTYTGGQKFGIFTLIPLSLKNK